MKRQKVISQVTLGQSSDEVLAARARHEAKGYTITNMKETLLHNVVAFESLENGIYDVMDEMYRLGFSKRTVTIFGYAISRGTKCLICGHYFKRLVKDLGIEDFDSFAFTDEELDLISYAEAVAADPNHVPDDIYEKIQARYDEERLVVVVTFSVMLLANNYFNNIVGTQLDEYLYPYYEGDDPELCSLKLKAQLENK